MRINDHILRLLEVGGVDLEIINRNGRICDGILCVTIRPNKDNQEVLLGVRTTYGYLAGEGDILPRLTATNEAVSIRS